jgi:lipopolysaccharide/colanic/teichoic acid biosynthesis glycosyltransferase
MAVAAAPVQQRPGRAYRRMREAVDPVLAALMLVLLLPLLAVIALAVVIDDGRPVFFRQDRVGRGGRPFRIVKFRTMAREAPPVSLKVDEASPLITRVGRGLRVTGLDEAPNLWNVVRGDMALIGPRPEQLGLIDRYEPWQLERHDVKPGITGWWQIHHRDTEPMYLNVDKDIHYVRHQGPALDALIVLGTLRVLVAGLVRRVIR